jgi:hypothetical protein
MHFNLSIILTELELLLGGEVLVPKEHDAAFGNK